VFDHIEHFESQAKLLLKLNSFYEYM